MVRLGECNTVTVDLGIEALLCGCDKDEDFCTYFPDYLAESRAELAREPLSLPIPPENYTTPTYPPIEATATSNADHHYRVLSERQNTIPTTSATTLKDEDIQKFVDKEKNKNTKRKTDSDLRKWYHWCEEHGENRQLADIPPPELDRLLGHFFITVRKKDGTLYEPDTLTSFQRSIDRHIAHDIRKPFSILRDQQFTSSREALKAV